MHQKPNALFRVAIAIFALPIYLFADSAAAALPPDSANRLQQLLAVNDAAAFASQASDFWQQSRNDWDENTKNEVRTALGNRAKQLLLGAGVFNALELENAKILVDFAKTAMSPAERANLDQQIQARFADVHALTFSQLQSRVELSRDLRKTGYAERKSGVIADAYSGKHELAVITADWLAQQELSNLSDSELQWCFRNVCPVVKDQDGFSAAWTGFLTVPHTGDYTFSISPWNVSYEHTEGQSTRYYRQAMTVDVDNKRVVSAAPADWNYQSATPIRLEAGNRIPLHVEFHYERNETHRMCAAILYWRTQGIAKAVVPSSVLSTDQAGTPGLQAHYSWRENNADQIQDAELSEIDPNIDFIWPKGLIPGTRDTLAVRLADEFVNRWSQPNGDFLGDIGRKPVLLPELVALLPKNKLEGCLQSALNNPDQVNKCAAGDIRQIYETTRSADQEAIDVLGAWMTLHKDETPELTARAADYFKVNRMLYYRLSTYFAFEYPPALEVLERDYLQTADGSCCLPVAYTLAECNLLKESIYYPKKNRIEAWMAKLDERLADSTVQGDRRVNWLIARAQAEDIRFGESNRHAWNLPNLSLGQRWLDEALLTAESETARNRVKQEVIAKLVARGNLDEARHEIESAASNSHDVKFSTTMAQWRATIESFDAAETQRQASTLKGDQDFYRSRLVALRDQAATHGNTDAAAQFDQMINDMPSD